MPCQKTVQKICRIILLFACFALWNSQARAPDTWTEAKITNAMCGENGEVMVALDVQATPKHYHIRNVDNVEVVQGRGEPAPDPTDCKARTERKVRVCFRRVDGKDYAGEVTKIYLE